MKLKAGMKVRYKSSESLGIKRGDIGTLISGTSFHYGDNIQDEDGAYWAEFNAGALLCMGSRKSFTVLKDKS